MVFHVYINTQVSLLFFEKNYKSRVDARREIKKMKYRTGV